MAADIEYLIDPKITQEVVDAKNKLKQQADRAEDILDSLKDGAGSGEPSTGGGIEEAPEDNDKYVRENGAWVVLPDFPSLPEIIPEAPEDGKTYGRKGGTWAEIDTSSSGGTVSEWGDIQGTLSNQTDLQTALDSKLEYVSWGDVHGSLTDQGDLKDELDAKIENVYWGRIEGSITSQKDLKTALDSKLESLDLGLESLGKSMLVLKNSGGDDLRIRSATTEHAGLMTVGDRNKLSGLDKPDWNTPESEAGGISNKPTLGSLSSEDDAPSDGKQYARKDGAWSEVEAGGGGAGGQSYTPFSWTPDVTKILLDPDQGDADGSYTPQILDAFTNNEIKGNVLTINLHNKENSMDLEIPDPKKLGWNVGDQFVLDLGRTITYRQNAFGQLRIGATDGYRWGYNWGSLRGFHATAAEIEASPFYNPLTKQCTLLMTAKNAKPDGSSMVFHVTPI